MEPLLDASSVAGNEAVMSPGVFVAIAVLVDKIGSVSTRLVFLNLRISAADAHQDARLLVSSGPIALDYVVLARAVQSDPVQIVADHVVLYQIVRSFE
jgi:hypothetical protein